MFRWFRRRPAHELDLEPKLQVRRLNRLAVLLAAMIGIVVLWVAYYVLSSRTPISQPDARKAPPSIEPERLALERLQLEAQKRSAPPGSFPSMTPRSTSQARKPRTAAPVEQPSRPRRPTRPDTAAQAASQKLHRALGADVLAPGFNRAASSSSESRFKPTLLDPGELEARLLKLSHAAGSVTAAPEPRSAQLAVPASPYEIQEGSLIPAILTAGIHSDLPGQTAALVRRNVYDSVSGKHLLIPQGARLVGHYDHRIAWGQNRILLAWKRLIFPDGRSLDLNEMPGADLAAMAGVRDKVDNHFVRTFGSALLLSAVSAGSQLSQPQESTFGGVASARQIAAAALGQELGRTAAEITRRNVEVEPTLEIRPGYMFNVEVTADLVLPGPYQEMATSR